MTRQAIQRLPKTKNWAIHGVQVTPPTSHQITVAHVQLNSQTFRKPPLPPTNEKRKITPLTPQIHIKTKTTTLREHSLAASVLAGMKNHTAPPEPALASVCRAIHPEDLSTGDYITVLQQTHQLVTFFWCAIDAHQFPPNEPIELTIRGHFDALEVKDICFPFLLCTDNQGEVHVIDSRSHQLGKLAPSFVSNHKKATKAHQRKLDKKKKSKKRKKRKAKA